MVTNGFVKKSRKTPKGELERAQSELKRYRAAKSKGALEIEEDDQP